MSLNRRKRRKIERNKKLQRGTIFNHKVTSKLSESWVPKERLNKIVLPLIDRQNKGIQRKYPTRIDKPSVFKIWEDRNINEKGLYDDNNPDGLNCLGNPFVDLGEVDYRVSDSVENNTPRFMSFGQMVEMNSSKMVTPNGSTLHWDHGLTDEYIEKILKEKLSIRDELIPITYTRFITNSTVFNLTEELGFTDDILNESELMKEYMCWCVRFMFNFEGNTILFGTPVDTYLNVMVKQLKMVG